MIFYRPAERDHEERPPMLAFSSPRPSPANYSALGEFFKLARPGS